MPQDFEEAAGWLRKSAEQGSVPAAYMLGLQYAKGGGVPHDVDTALKWLDAAAANSTRQLHQKIVAARDAVAKDAIR